MRRLLALVALLALGAPLVGMTPWGAEPSGSLPTCVHVTLSAPYRGIGYDHIVTIQNACLPTADCVVTTDVNPSPINVSVPRGETMDVLTWRGSPARQFQADVTCKLRS